MVEEEAAAEIIPRHPISEEAAAVGPPSGEMPEQQVETRGEVLTVMTPLHLVEQVDLMMQLRQEAKLSMVGAAEEEINLEQHHLEVGVLCLVEAAAVRVEA